MHLEIFEAQQAFAVSFLPVASVNMRSIQALAMQLSEEEERWLENIYSDDLFCEDSRELEDTGRQANQLSPARQIAPFVFQFALSLFAYFFNEVLNAMENFPRTFEKPHIPHNMSLVQIDYDNSTASCVPQQSREKGPSTM